MITGLTLGPLTFLAPLALLGLLILPLIWWLLRITPPKPLTQLFPPLRILQKVVTEDETPNSTPLWLLLFRLGLTALIAFALAQPLLSKPEGIEARPIILVIDNGWDAAPNWPKITKEAENRISDARRKGMDVMVLATAAKDNQADFINPSDALSKIKSLSPQAVQSDRSAVMNLLRTSDLSGSDIFWLSSGVTRPSDSVSPQELEGTSNQVFLSPASSTLPLVPGALSETVDGFRTLWHRAGSNGLRTTDITAHTQDGRIIARNSISFSPGQTQAEALIELPSELRSRITALRVADSAAAGSVLLLDDNWGRPLIGVLTEGRDTGSPLLTEPFYAETALRPFADVYRGDLDDLLPLAPSIIVMPDEARNDTPEIRQFVENGGLLIRFAGPKLAKRADAYLPVSLRQGGRALGGALTWEDPQNLAAFSAESPFFGLSIPDDIEVNRQIMAQPGAETDSRTWARLEDGSPIVTSSELGFGRIVLFHVTAGPEWSNIPVSGLYVDMLRRLLTLARASPAKTQVTSGDWAPERVLNGYGRLMSPDLFAKSIAYDKFETTEISSSHPPGLYRQGPRRKALNVKSHPNNYAVAKPLPGMKSASYGETKDDNFGGRLLSFALFLLAIDVVFALIVSGRVRGLLSRLGQRTGQTAGVLLALTLMAAPDSFAQEDHHYDDALKLRLAYIETGNTRTDRMSEAALEGLAYELNRRTTIEPVGVRAVDPAEDELVFYPFLYWPVERDADTLTDKAATALNGFMASGGVIVFDTQDSGDQFLRAGNAHPGLKNITEKLEIPTLAEVPVSHVLNKSYFLIDVYPGRWANGRVWVDQNQNGAARDGVSSVIVGSNDWAAGWARDDTGQPLVQLERDIARQREMSYRFGINLTMYTLAGNYKADQVHAKTLIERQGLAPREVEDLGSDNEVEE